MHTVHPDRNSRWSITDQNHCYGRNAIGAFSSLSHQSSLDSRHSLYGLAIFTAGILHPATFRASTILYTCMFVITFIVTYTAVWNYHIFTLDNFIKFMRLFFFVLIGFLLAQQACLIVGIKLLPLINLCQVLNRGIGANSLTFEPSTLGRLLAVMYYALLKCLRDSQWRKSHHKRYLQG